MDHDMGNEADTLAATQPPRAEAQAAAGPFEPMPELSSDDRSKDEFYVRLALLADEMLKAHGKDFTMGVLVLSARFIAEGRPLIRRVSNESGTAPD
jgi:hypothetical protein